MCLFRAAVLRIPNFGRKSLYELKHLLSLYDLQLNMDIDGLDRDALKNLLQNG